MLDRPTRPEGLEAVLLALGKQLGLPGLCLDAHGCCQLEFQGGWVVTLVLHPHQDRLVLHCPISTAGEILPEIQLAMLQGNFMGCAVGGGSLAVGPDRRACIQQELPLVALSVAAVQQAIDRLLAAAQAWSKRLQGVAPRARPGPALGGDWIARQA